MSKSRFTSTDVKAMVRDIRESLLGKRVANIYDLTDKCYLLKFAVPGNSTKNLLLLESGIRFHTTKYARDLPELPSPFSMKLRRSLRTKRLENIGQIGADRIIDFKFGSGEQNVNHVILELYSHGNIVLTDNNYEVLALLRSHQFSEEVSLRVGEIYPLLVAATGSTTLTATNSTALMAAVNDSNSDNGDRVAPEKATAAVATVDADVESTVAEGIMSSATSFYHWAQGKVQENKEARSSTSADTGTSKKGGGRKVKDLVLRQLLLFRDSGVSDYGPEILDHCILRSGFKPGTKVEGIVNSHSIVGDRLVENEDEPNYAGNINKNAGQHEQHQQQGLNRLVAELQDAKLLVQKLYVQGPGYLIIKDTNKVTTSRGDDINTATNTTNTTNTTTTTTATTASTAKSLQAKQEQEQEQQQQQQQPQVEYAEFLPMLFAQHEGKPHVIYSSFNEAVDEYFRSIEEQKLNKDATMAETVAQRKLDKLHRDQEKMLSSLADQQTNMERGARLLEMHADDVDKATLVINSAMSSGMSWEDIEEMVQVETESGNFIASMIERLDLGNNRITLRLRDEEDEEDDEEEEEEEEEVRRSDSDIDNEEEREELPVMPTKPKFNADSMFDSDSDSDSGGDDHKSSAAIQEQGNLRSSPHTSEVTQAPAAVQVLKEEPLDLQQRQQGTQKMNIRKSGVPVHKTTSNSVPVPAAPATATTTYISVEIDLSKSAHANARSRYAKRKQAKEKEVRTLDASQRALQNVTQQANRDIQSQNLKRNLRAVRKVHWFEKFNWFITSEGNLVLSGRDAQQNEILVQRHLRPGDIFVHADIAGAAACIIRAKQRSDIMSDRSKNNKNTKPESGEGLAPRREVKEEEEEEEEEDDDDRNIDRGAVKTRKEEERKKDTACTAIYPISPIAIQEAGAMSVCRSSAWRNKIAAVAAYWVWAEQVSKRDASGEIISTTGAFYIRGKRNFLPPSPLEMGFGIMFCLDDASLLARQTQDRSKERGGGGGGGRRGGMLTGLDLPDDTSTTTEHLDRYDVNFDQLVRGREFRASTAGTGSGFTRDEEQEEQEVTPILAAKFLTSKLLAPTPAVSMLSIPHHQQPQHGNERDVDKQKEEGGDNPGRDPGIEAAAAAAAAAAADGGGEVDWEADWSGEEEAGSEQVGYTRNEEEEEEEEEEVAAAAAAAAERDLYAESERAALEEEAEYKRLLLERTGSIREKKKPPPHKQSRKEKKKQRKEKDLAGRTAMATAQQGRDEEEDSNSRGRGRGRGGDGEVLAEEEDGKGVRAGAGTGTKGNAVNPTTTNTTSTQTTKKQKHLNKKKARRYAEQDDEDRELAMLVLGHASTRTGEKLHETRARLKEEQKEAELKSRKTRAGILSDAAAVEEGEDGREGLRDASRDGGNTGTVSACSWVDNMKRLLHSDVQAAIQTHLLDTELLIHPTVSTATPTATAAGKRKGAKSNQPNASRDGIDVFELNSLATFSTSEGTEIVKLFAEGLRARSVGNKSAFLAGIMRRYATKRSNRDALPPSTSQSEVQTAEAAEIATSREEQAEIDAILAQEADDEEEKLRLADDIEKLTGMPKPGDQLMYAIPVCGPYGSMQYSSSTGSQMKYKVKLVPGLAKKGKTAKQAIELFTRAKECSPMEKALMDGLTDPEIVAIMIGDVKLQMPGLHLLQSANKAQKKNKAPQRGQKK